MGVSLSLSTSHDSYNASTNSSVVTVTVTINWTTSSYNGYSPSGTLTIDGTSYGFSSNFNYSNGSGPVSVSGSVVACTKTVTVPHGSDGNKMLFCSASFNSGVSSGTVTAEASRYLTSSGSGDSGGGGGGGGDDGDDSGGSGGGDVSGGDYEQFIANVSFVIAPHSSVRVYATSEIPPSELRLKDTVTESGDRRYDTSANGESGVLQFVFSVEPGYVLTEYGIVGHYAWPGNIVLLDGGGEENTFSVVTNVVPNDYVLSVDASEGANIEVYRSSSEITAAGPLYDGDVIYYDDVIKIDFSCNKGYMLDTHTVNGAVFESGDSIVVNSDLDISATAKIDESAPSVIDSVRIDNGVAMAQYQIFIENGTTWNAFGAFVDDGTEYKPYS